MATNAMETQETGTKTQELNTGKTRQKNIKIRVLEIREQWCGFQMLLKPTVQEGGGAEVEKGEE